MHEAVIAGVGDVPLEGGKVTPPGSALQIIARCAKAALDEGPRMMTRIVAEDADRVAIGARFVEEGGLVRPFFAMEGAAP